MERLTTLEYARQVSDIFSFEELEFIQDLCDELYDRSSGMDKVDYFSLCIESFLEQKEKNKASLKTGTERSRLKGILSNNIKRYSSTDDFVSFEECSEVGYMDSYQDDSLDDLLSLCKDSSDLPHLKILQSCLNGKTRREISQEFGISTSKIMKFIDQKWSRLSDLYYQGLVGVMDEGLVKYYETFLYGDIEKALPFSFRDNWNMFRAVSLYENGYVPTKTDMRVFDTINEMRKDSQQRMVKRI